MSKPTPEELLQITIMSSFESIKHHQKLINEWNDPDDIVQRAAVVILETHKMYGRMAFQVFKMLQNKCRHPKKKQNLCADGTVYCMNCNANLKDDSTFIKT